MSGKRVKRIRRQVMQQEEKIIVKFLLDIESLPFFDRLKIAWRILKGVGR